MFFPFPVSASRSFHCNKCTLMNYRSQETTERGMVVSYWGKALNPKRFIELNRVHKWSFGSTLEYNGIHISWIWTCTYCTIWHGMKESFKDRPYFLVCFACSRDCHARANVFAAVKPTDSHISWLFLSWNKSKSTHSSFCSPASGINPPWPYLCLDSSHDYRNSADHVIFCTFVFSRIILRVRAKTIRDSKPY